jgi:alkyl hydroperoxide reductase subunit D
MDKESDMLNELDKKIPHYARDLYITLKTAIETNELGKKQIWGSVLASAIASRNIAFTKSIIKYAKEYLNDDEVEAVNSAAAIMALNNKYWRFWYLADDLDYLNIPHQLSDEAIHPPSENVSVIDYECWQLAVSVINGCAGCVKVHSRALLKNGFTKEKVLSIVRIASVIYAIAVTMENGV